MQLTNHLLLWNHTSGEHNEVMTGGRERNKNVHVETTRKVFVSFWVILTRITPTVVFLDKSGTGKKKQHQ